MGVTQFEVFCLPSLLSCYHTLISIASERKTRGGKKIIDGRSCRTVRPPTCRGLEGVRCAADRCASVEGRDDRCGLDGGCGIGPSVRCVADDRLADERDWPLLLLVRDRRCSAASGADRQSDHLASGVSDGTADRLRVLAQLVRIAQLFEEAIGEQFALVKSVPR
jgi:hypothetical protein